MIGGSRRSLDGGRQKAVLLFLVSNLRRTPTCIHFLLFVMQEKQLKKSPITFCILSISLAAASCAQLQHADKSRALAGLLNLRLLSSPPEGLGDTKLLPLLLFYLTDSRFASSNCDSLSTLCRDLIRFLDSRRGGGMMDHSQSVTEFIAQQEFILRAGYR